MNWRSVKDSNLHNLAVACLANKCGYHFANTPLKLAGQGRFELPSSDFGGPDNSRYTTDLQKMYSPIRTFRTERLRTDG